MGQLGLGFRFGACEVRPEDGTVRSPSGLTRLGPRPMGVLLTLAGQPGRVFSRDELMATVWAGVVVSDETLSRCISDLRQALDDDPRSPRYIETLPRRGYRAIERPVPLTAPPHGELGDPQPADAPGAEPAPRTGGSASFDEAPPAAPEPAIVPAPQSDAGASRTLPTRMLWLAGSLVLLLAAAAWLPAWREPGPPPAAAAPLAKNGIAVLPFANLSDDAGLDYFSDGLAEEILHRLASVEALAVVARTSAFSFKGSNKDVREIGRALGVSYVLEGSVRRHGERIRIGAQLIDVQSGFHLFSRVYERPFTDLSAIQEHVAQEVGAALEPRLAGLLEGFERPVRETVPAALEAYLLARHLQRKLTADDLERAAREYRRAIELDPGFARAHAGLAQTLALTSQYAAVPVAEVGPAAETHAAEALALDPGCAEAWHARGLVAFYETRFGDALEAFETAHRLDSSATGSVSMQAWTLRSLGRNREALRQTAEVLRSDPLNLHAINVHATVLIELGDFDAGERLLRRSMEIDRTYPNALWGMGYLKWLTGQHAESVRWYRAGIDAGIRQGEAFSELGRVLLELGAYPQSLEWIETGLARSPDPIGQLDALIAWYQYQGDFAGLARAVQAYHERFPDHVGLAPYRAIAALTNGDPATAIREYESLTGRASERLHSHWDMASGYWHALYLARARQLVARPRAAEATLLEAQRRLAVFEKETGHPGIVPYYQAAIASLRGDADGALALLEEARRTGWRRADEIRNSPLFDALQRDARLDLLLARVRAGLTEQRRLLASTDAIELPLPPDPKRLVSAD